MSYVTTREQRRQLDRDNLAFTEHLVEQAHAARTAQRIGKSTIERVWRSRRFLVTLWLERSGHHRLTMQRSKLTPSGEWEDGISWDDLQRLKAEAGFGDAWAVECFPPDHQVVNVANMRHLWLLPYAPAFAWNRGGR